MLVEAVAADKRMAFCPDMAYDSKGFFKAYRVFDVTQHVAHTRNRRGGGAIDRRTTRGQSAAR